MNEWVSGQESICPDCEVPLIAKRGEIKIWHWAHKTNEQGCGSFETYWHLCWKSVYLTYPGWVIEHPIEIDGKRYRLDAFNPKGARAREFVHSLSSFYVDKHEGLLGAGYDVLWIWDGEAFKRKWTRFTHTDRGYYLKDFMKPGPKLTFSVLGGYLHYNQEMFRGWTRGYSDTGEEYIWWFPVNTNLLYKMCRDFAQIRKRYHEKKRVFPEVAGLIPEVSGSGSD